MPDVHGPSATLLAELTTFAEETLADRSSPGPLFLGLNGPQGCGKSTVAAALVERFAASGRSALALSIDDFYLTFEEQRALAARFPGNPYLEHRGYPGTHDVPLGDHTLGALRRAEDGAVVAIPAYDKSAHGGRGDRRVEGAWPRVQAPLELVILEGWMLGFPALGPEAEGSLSDRHLAAAAALLAPYAAWMQHVDAFVHLDAAEPTFVLEWRVDAERARRARGAAALTDEEARDYVERFLPAYALWVPRLRAEPPGRDGRPLPHLHVVLGQDREPVGARAPRDEPLR